MKTKITDIYFDHIYHISGFAISRMVANDGLDHKQPDSRHACMEHSYWCPKQLQEQGLGSIVAYLESFKIPDPFKVLNAIKKQK